MSRPIVVYSYNRPQYLNASLVALQPQVKNSEIFLFQDGPRPFTNDIDLIKHSIEVFRHYFPQGKLFFSERNLGVAFNQKKARDFIFERYDSAIFVEDDIVLNSYYIEQLNLLMDLFETNMDVAMASCFGESHRHTDVFKYCDYLIQFDDWDRQQENNKNQFMQMEHLWAYGFFRRAYEKIKPFMEGYYSMLPTEYRRRPHQQILQYCDQHGLSQTKIVTSQDSVLSGFLALNNMAKVSTFTMNAKYIGEWGEHSNAQHYAQNWKHIKPYDCFVKDFVWNNEIKEKIKTICKAKSLK
jgi:hypothetical protein